MIYSTVLSFLTFLSSFKDMPIDFKEWGREKEREGDKHRHEGETSMGWLLHIPGLGTKLAI